MIPLTAEKQHQVDCVRERMQTAGVVFDFTVRLISESENKIINEAQHRQILLYWLNQWLIKPKVADTLQSVVKIIVI